MRLSKEEVENIKSSVTSVDPNAKTYLFGSRTDVSKRGGDIDLLIISGKITKKELSKIRWDFFEEFGEQKIDIVIDDGTGQTPFVKLIIPQAVAL